MIAKKLHKSKLEKNSQPKTIQNLLHKFLKFRPYSPKLF